MMMMMMMVGFDSEPPVAEPRDRAAGMERIVSAACKMFKSQNDGPASLRAPTKISTTKPSITVTTNRSQQLKRYQQSYNGGAISKTSLLVGAALGCYCLLLVATVRCQTNSDPISHQDATSISNDQNATTATATTTSNKLKPVNFTLVDEIFAATLDDDELVKRWRNMDAQFQDGIRSILKLVFPQIVAISQDAKVSGDCSGGILKWILSLRNLRSWAIKMLDATGKPTAGIFEGSLTMFGNYRQCINIRAPDEDEIEITDQFEEYFRGQFCVIHLKPWMPAKRPFYHLNSTIEPLLRKNYKYYEKTLYDELAEIAVAFNFLDIRMDLCVPSTCTVADIQRVAELLSRKLEMRAKVMRCDTGPKVAGMLQHIDQTTSLWLIVPLGLTVTVLLATLLTCVGPLAGGTVVDSQNDDRTHGHRQDSRRKCLVKLLDCLSVGGILRSRFSRPGGSLDELTSLFDQCGHSASQDTIDDGPLQQVGSVGRATGQTRQRKPLPLYGLRNLFIFWFILVQMTVELKYQYLRESLVLRNMLLSYWPFQIIINSTQLFESLILITAFTFSYSNLESNLRDLVGYMTDKYARLMPSIVSLIGLTIVTPLVAIESPVWRNFVESQANICKTNGYLDLFFLQNFIPYEKICLPHTWLFCVEFQLMVLSIPLIILLKKTFTNNEDSIVICGQKANENTPKKLKSSSYTPSTSSSSSSRQLCQALSQLLKSKAGLVGCALVVLGALVNFALVYTYKLPPSWFYTFPDVDQKNYYFGEYLTKTWTHLSVFFIGLYAGYLCRSSLQLEQMKQLTSSDQIASASAQEAQTSNKTHGTSFILDYGLQLSSLICMMAIVFSTYSWSTGDAPTPLVAAIYDSSSRVVWSLALVAIMVQLCLPTSRGQYSRFARFLSHPMCIVLGRLSFLAYLISPYVNTFVLAVEEQSLFPSLFLIFHVVVGNIVITYLVAFVMSIIIEQPIRLIVSNFLICQTYSSGRMTTTTSTILITPTIEIQTTSQRLKTSGGSSNNNNNNINNNNQDDASDISLKANGLKHNRQQIPTIVATSH